MFDMPPSTAPIFGLRDEGFAAADVGRRSLDAAVDAEDEMGKALRESGGEVSSAAV